MTKKREILLILLAAVLFLAVVVGIILTGNYQKNDVALLDAPPMLVIDGEHFIRHELTVKIMPQGYFYAGKITKEMANNTDLEGCEYYVNPYKPDVIYVCQQDAWGQGRVYAAWKKAENTT